MYKVKDLWFAYGKRRIFKEFNLEINDAMTGIVGINGAGKTTLVKLSLRLLHPEKGEIFINDVKVTNEKEYTKARVGVLHENARFPPWVKVLEHLVWVGRMRGFKKGEAIEQAELFIEELGLVDRWNSYVNELSAGLRQRFGIAQALIGLPDVVFLDEPTANLDARSRVHVLDFIKRLTQEHKIQAIIFSHILTDLEKYCDSAVILHEGEIKYQEEMQYIFETVQPREFIIRYHPKDEMNILHFLQEMGIKVTQKQESSMIIQVSREFKDTQVLLKEIHDKQGLVTPFKSTLEQLFFDLTGSNAGNN